MPKKQSEWPQRNEIVLGTVTRVNPFSAFVSLDEYGKKEGMIHISEVAGRWVKDIRDFVKPNQTVIVKVLNVDKEKGHITLSLKKVGRHDASEKLKEFKREQKAEKMLANLAKEYKLSMEEAYKEVGFKLIDAFGEMFKGFQAALTQPGYDFLIKNGLPSKWTDAVKAVAQKQMEVKEVTLKEIIELKCLKPDGIDIIRSVLKKTKEQYGIDIKYISAPKYSVTLKTKDAKNGERRLREISEDIINSIKSLGGEGTLAAG